MTTPLRDPSIRDPSIDVQAREPTRGLATSSPHHPWRHFARHFLEMAAVMVGGMLAAGFVFMVVLNLAIDGEITWEQALVDYPAQALLVVAVGMSVPMIPWMRHRGHSRRSAYEMAAVMAVPAIPFVCLALFDVVKGAQCSLYCLIGFVAMPALMIYRRSEYGVGLNTA
jgi:cytochrome bd-type quinol oxidase subunit 2